MSQVFIIAEAGVNHNGSVDVAKKMIDAAAAAGADAVKFQTFKAERLVSRRAPKAEYQMEHTDRNESHYEMIKKLEIDEEAHRILIDHCRQRNILFLSSPFDRDSVNLLDKLGLTIFKLPSGEITNFPYLRHIGSLKKDIIMSTGMADLVEIANALKVLVEAGTPKERITVLHCNSEYPTLMEDVNLRALQTIANTFGVRTGYSDHTIGIEAPIAAVALGATVVEKHFTLDKNMPGPDHKASLEPAELTAMIEAIRNIEKALGDGRKEPSSSELKNKPVARKSIVAARDIKKGELLTEENITTKRPGTGLSPMIWNQVLHQKAKRDFKADELIEA